MPKDAKGRMIRKGDRVRRVSLGGEPIPTRAREVEVVRHIGTKHLHGRIALAPIGALGFVMRVWEPAADYEKV